MIDGGNTYRATMVLDSFELEWLIKCSDLNPTENLRQELKKQWPQAFYI